MSRVFGFPGLRYDAARAPDLAAVLCPPYDVISADEQARLRARSPYNAVLLELPADPPNEPGARYRAAAERLDGWQRSGVLRPDRQPTLALHETVFVYGDRTYRRRDLIAAVAVEPWSAGTVLPHEHTMAGPKQDRLALMREVHANLSPVWLLHREEPAALAEAWARAEQSAPTAEFHLDGDEQHRVWVLGDAATLGRIERGFAEEVRRLYIADGHHRYETALAFRAEAERQQPGAASVLAVLTPSADPGLLVLPTHRLLHGLPAALTADQLMTRWSSLLRGAARPLEADPATSLRDFLNEIARGARRQPTFGMLGPGDRGVGHLLRLRERTPAAGLLPADRSAAWRSLDVALLHTLIVDPLVAETGRPRDQVLRYTRAPLEALADVRAGPGRAAFLLNPTPVEHVLAVADAGDRMPEKSTYFYPKPPTGLVIRDLARG